MNDDDLVASYVIPEGDDHPGALFAELSELDEHQHFAEHEIPVEFLLRVDPKVKAGRQVLGQCMLPTVQGELKGLFEQLLAQWFGRMPHFLIVLDQAWWMGADDMSRRALLEHEMCHVRQLKDKNGDDRFDKDGNPVFGIVNHDVEEFSYIVRKYGCWNPTLREFIDAASEHK